MFLVTGPTGSGKTVSLYSGINLLNQPDINISTAEDPVEINLPGVNQVQVDERTGMTFDKALKVWEFSDSGMKRLTPHHRFLSELLVLHIGCTRALHKHTGFAHAHCTRTHTHSALYRRCSPRYLPRPGARSTAASRGLRLCTST